MSAIERVWSAAGVAILVDLGGAETNSEMAIEMLPEERRGRGRHVQRADRRGRSHGGDRSRRADAIAGAACARTAEELSPR